MRHPTRAGIGLVRLGNSDFVPANPEDDLRSKDVYDAEAVTQVAEDRVTIEPGRTEKVEGPAPFDTKVAPPADDRPADDCAWLPYGNAESPADPRNSSLRDIHRPHHPWDPIPSKS